MLIHFCKLVLHIAHVNADIYNELHVIIKQLFILLLIRKTI